MYRQPETGWAIPDPLAGSLDDNAEKIQKHRLANPRFPFSTDFEECRADLIRQTCARNPNWCIGGPDDLKKVLSLSQRHAPVESAAGGVKRVAAGIRLLIDWLGHGARPVANALAEERARVCAGCPKNIHGDWMAMFTVPVAEQIRTQLEMRKEMNLSTSSDPALHVCAGCDCPLRLKVHVPIATIQEYTDPAVWARLDPRCWMLKETGQ